MKNLNWVLAALLVFVACGISIFVIYITTQRTLSSVESILWQVFVLTTGLAGSFIFGRQSAQETAMEVIKPHARSAFRRLLSLYHSLSRAAAAIESSQRSESHEEVQVVLAKLEVIVVEQLAATDDALEDWRDIVPEDVDELLQSKDIKRNRQ